MSRQTQFRIYIDWFINEANTEFGNTTSASHFSYSCVRFGLVVTCTTTRLLCLSLKTQISTFSFVLLFFQVRRLTNPLYTTRSPPLTRVNLGLTLHCSTDSISYLYTLVHTRSEHWLRQHDERATQFVCMHLVWSCCRYAIPYLFVCFALFRSWRWPIRCAPRTARRRRVNVNPALLYRLNLVFIYTGSYKTWTLT